MRRSKYGHVEKISPFSKEFRGIQTRDEAIELIGDYNVLSLNEKRNVWVQHGIARRQGVDDRRLPRAGARRGKDHDWAAGLEYRLAAR